MRDVVSADEAQRLRDATRMVGACCYGCGKAGTKRRPVTQRDLGSPVKWHAGCYRAAERQEQRASRMTDDLGSLHVHRGGGPA